MCHVGRPVGGEEEVVDADGDTEPCWSGVTVTVSPCNNYNAEHTTEHSPRLCVVDLGFTQSLNYIACCPENFNQQIPAR